MQIDISKHVADRNYIQSVWCIGRTYGIITPIKIHIIIRIRNNNACNFYVIRIICGLIGKTLKCYNMTVFSPAITATVDYVLFKNKTYCIAISQFIDCIDQIII